MAHSLGTLVRRRVQGFLRLLEVSIGRRGKVDFGICRFAVLFFICDLNCLSVLLGTSNLHTPLVVKRNQLARLCRGLHGVVQEILLRLLQTLRGLKPSLRIIFEPDPVDGAVERRLV